MYLLRKNINVIFIAGGRIQSAATEITLRGTNDTVLHNHWYAMQSKILSTVYALDGEDIEIEKGSITTDQLTLEVSTSLQIIPKVMNVYRPCILCSLEKHFLADDIDIEMMPYSPTFLKESETVVYPASIFWVGGKSFNGVTLYTDKGELADKTILIGSAEDFSSNSPDIIEYLVAPGMTADVDNDYLCNEMYVIIQNLGEIAFVQD